jgi:hypothetical protein
MDVEILLLSLVTFSSLPSLSWLNVLGDLICNANVCILVTQMRPIQTWLGRKETTWYMEEKRECHQGPTKRAADLGAM